MKKVLLIFYPDAKREMKILSLAKKLQFDQNVELNIMYVIPRLPGYLFQSHDTENVAQKQQSDAENALKQIGRVLHVDSDRQWLAKGNITAEAKFLQTHLHVDEIIGMPRVWELWRHGSRKLKTILTSPVGQLGYTKYPLKSAR